MALGLGILGGLSESVSLVPAQGSRLVYFGVVLDISCFLSELRRATQLRMRTRTSQTLHPS